MNSVRFAISLMLMGLTVCTAAQNSPARLVGTGAALTSVLVRSALIQRETAFDGVIEAVNQSTVSAQTSGRVVELPFDVGDAVEKNAVIVRLTTTEQQARSAAAEAALAEAKAHLAEAQIAHDRIRDIFTKKLVAKAQFDQATADLDSARARFAAARATLSGAREGLGYTVVRSPYAGIVIARHVQLGETVTPGKALMTGVSLAKLRVVVDIPQLHIGPLRKHSLARVILPGPVSVTPTKLRIPPNANPATHSFRVRVTLPMGVQDTYPGTLVKVAFVMGQDRRTLVPASALVRRGEVTGVYVIAKGAPINFRYLRIATPLADGRVPVLSGLDVGERIALDPIAAAIAYKKQALLAKARG